MKMSLFLVSFLALSVSVNQVQADSHEHKAHVHGAAKMDIAFEVDRISVDIESPAEAFVGFEHAPKSAKDKKKAEEVLALLKDSSNLIQFSKDAGCKQTEVKVEGEALGIPSEEAHEKGHSDVDLSYVFTCEKPNELKNVEVVGFKKFAKLKKLETSFVSKASQKKADLTAKSAILNF